MDKNLLKALGLLFVLVAIVGVFLYFSVNAVNESKSVTQEECIKKVQQQYNITDEQLNQMKAESTDGIIAVPPEAIEAYKSCVNNNKMIEPPTTKN